VDPGIDEVVAAAPRLRIRGLDAGYGRVQVLFGLDLDVAPGEAVAVLGTNGAGKTTLLRTISALLTPTAGRIELDGKTISGLPPEACARAGVGRTFQVARSNVVLPAPLAPSTATASPGATSRSSPNSTWTRP
jgi:ABC-type branched-subunit amino acid transport system ATPase component